MKQINDKLIFGKDKGTSISQTEVVGWIEQGFIDEASLYGAVGLYFPTATTGFIALNDKIYKSEDAGKTWEIASTISGVEFVQTITGTSTTNLYTGGSLTSYASGCFLRSTDGGDTWSSAIVVTGTSEIKDIAINSGVLIAAGYAPDGSDTKGSISKSIDDGDTWTTTSFTGTMLFNKVTFASSTNVFAISSNLDNVFALYRSTNSGTSWTQITIPTFYAIKDVFFMDANTGYAIGYDVDLNLLMAATTDGGNTWDPAFAVPHLTTVDKIIFNNYIQAVIFGYDITGSPASIVYNGGIFTLPERIANTDLYFYYAVNIDPMSSSQEYFAIGSKEDQISICRTENNGINDLKLIIRRNDNTKPNLTPFTIKDDYDGRGLEYYEDYSSTFTDRSLIDFGFLKSYFDTGDQANTLFVTVDGTSDGVRGNINRPFSIGSAANNALAGDVIVVFPGAYNLTTTNGLPLKNNVNYFMLNPIFTSIIPNNRGSIAPLINTNCKIYGKAKFINNNLSSSGIIAPSAQCNIYVEGCEFISSKGLFGTANELDGALKYFNFKDCSFISSDSTATIDTEAFTTRKTSKWDFVNCYIEGLVLVRIFAGLSQSYNFKAVNTTFKAKTNTNGINSSINLTDLGEDGDGKVFLINCNFISTTANITVSNDGTSGYSSGKTLIIYDSKFINGSAGWLVSDWNDGGGSLTFKLINNYSTYDGSGDDFPVLNNILTNPGFYTEANLEL